MALTVDDYLRALEDHGHALADVAARTDLATPAPDCPGWTVRHVVEHTAQVHRWATRQVVDGRAAPDSVPQTPHLPADHLISHFRDGHATLVSALREADDDLDAMRFLHDAPPARTFWARRQAHETAIHRSDVEVATGTPPSYHPGFATDGIDELLIGFYGRRRGRLRSDDPRTLGIHATDTGHAWSITIGPDHRDVRREPAVDADCRIHGPAAAIYPFLWNRTVATPPAVDGDPSVLALWRDLARVTWS